MVGGSAVYARLSAFAPSPERESMSLLLEGRVCLVTGAGRGIGRAIVELFARQGAFVYANERVEGAVTAWREALDPSVAGAIEPVVFDVSQEEAVREVILRAKREKGSLDVLVNNAAIEANELIGMISEDHMRRMTEVNVYGPIYAIQAASRVMRRQERGGSIINIASLTALRGSAGQLVYSATKGAVVALTKSAAKELSPFGVRVNAIAPGLTNTGMMQAADPVKLEARIANIGMGRVAEPEDIAKACLFMASDLSGYVSGQVLAVDGCTIM